MEHKKQATVPTNPSLLRNSELGKRVVNLVAERRRRAETERRRTLKYPDLPLIGPNRMADFVIPPREYLEAA